MSMIVQLTKEDMKRNKVCINVSGERYETFEITLSRFPGTLLGDAVKRRQYRVGDAFFFNRHRASFEAILFFYQSFGKLSCPADIPLHVFESECRFFGIHEASIEEMKTRYGYLTVDTDDQLEATTLKDKVWNFLDNPGTSSMATAFAIVSQIVILISVISTCAETVSEFYGEPGSSKRRFWELMELALNVWFLTELLARIFSTPNRFKFFKQVLTIVDVIAVLPYFAFLALGSDNMGTLGFLKILRFTRVIRLFRLSRHSKRLKVAGAIVSSSLNDLQLLFVCLMLFNILGGSIMYYLENAEPGTEFTSIPQGIWWGITTIVTLGYGDITPLTIAGKCIAGAYMLFGALTISLPVLSIVTKFTHMYEINIVEEDEEGK